MKWKTGFTSSARSNGANSDDVRSEVRSLVDKRVSSCSTDSTWELNT